MSRVRGETQYPAWGVGRHDTPPTSTKRASGVNGYRFDVDCRYCGGELVEETNGRWSHLEVKAVARCSQCRTAWLVVARMVELSDGRSRVTPARMEALAKVRAAKRTKELV